jgi:hypothetical protein
VLQVGKWLPILSRVVTKTIFGDEERHWNVVQNNGVCPPSLSLSSTMQGVRTFHISRKLVQLPSHTKHIQRAINLGSCLSIFVLFRLVQQVTSATANGAKQEPELRNKSPMSISTLSLAHLQSLLGHQASRCSVAVSVMSSMMKRVKD